MSTSIQKSYFKFILQLKFNFAYNKPLRMTNNNTLTKYDKVRYL